MQRAYGNYVERIGMRPGPMDEDYGAVVRDGHAFVADVEGDIAGLLVLVPCDDHLLIENVAVEPARQSQGIGQALMAYAERRAGELGLGELRLYTHVKMTENRALYARLGYREDEERVEEGFARVFMSKRLGE